MVVFAQKWTRLGLNNMVVFAQKWTRLGLNNMVVFAQKWTRLGWNHMFVFAQKWTRLGWNHMVVFAQRWTQFGWNCLVVFAQKWTLMASLRVQVPSTTRNKAHFRASSAMVSTKGTTDCFFKSDILRVRSRNNLTNILLFISFNARKQEYLTRRGIIQ
jgi:hypothetical protein